MLNTKKELSYRELKKTIELLEKKLKKTEEDYYLLFDKMTSGFALHEMIYDHEGNPVNYLFLKVNKAFEKLTGLKGKDILHKSVLDVLPKTEPYWIETYGKVAKTGEPVKFENYAQEIEKHFDVYVYSPKKDHFVTIFNDITDRVSIERALKSSEHKYRNLVETLQEGIWLIDKDAYTTYVNPRMAEILGYSIEEMQGKHLFDFMDDQGIVICKQNLERRELGITESHDFEFIEKKGGRVYVSMATNPMYDEKGEYMGALAAVSDITDRKVMEEKLNQQNQQLSESYTKIKRINDELLESKRKAEESDKLKSAFLANLSHEIRTPLNGIVGFSEMLRYPGFSEDKKKGFVEIINDSSQQLLRIVNDLVDISRIEAGQVEIKEVEVCINEILEELYISYRPLAEKKNIRLFLHKTLSDKQSKVSTDPVKLRQILDNLLNNALKFTNEGYVKWGYELTDGFLQFYVEDTGIGIIPDIHDIVFERFRQGDDSVVRNYGGTGLGLSIAKAYVERLKGEIWFTSKENQGSIFYFKISYNPINLPEKKGFNSEKKGDGKKPTFLIVEDEQINFLYLKELLLLHECNVLYAKNGEEAIEICKLHPEIDLVLMDIKLPGINGYEATKKIKSLRQHLPVIAQTAYAMAGDKEKAMEEGCDDYIAKPIQADDLIQVIRNYIRSTE